ncbi:AMP-binding protein [Streptomyces sp. G35A]
MRRSARTVVAQLALWWAGAACVPLDPAHPRPRSEAMAADAGVTLTVGEGKLLDAAALTGPVLALPEEAPLSDSSAPAPELGSDAAAFIMFTSGSTGRPKGVPVPHRAVAELVSEPTYVTLTPRDRVLFHSPMTFDASTCGGPRQRSRRGGLHRRPALARGPGAARGASRRHRRVLTTALFHQLAARRSRMFSVLRAVVVGGEALSAQHAGQVPEAFPWLELVNGYGPTETTTFVTAHRVTGADREGPVPTGRPVAGGTVHVLGDDGGPVADGARGEPWVGGSRLAHGYAGRPDLTAERFVDHPELGRLYRTGDLVSVRPDGVLDFHGRRDDQG